MPQILIVTDSPEGGEVVYRESVSPVHLATEHSGDQLVERLAWAVDDATLAERRARQAAAAGVKTRPGLRAA